MSKKKKMKDTKDTNPIDNSFNCCVMGLGYIGLPTAAIVAQREYKVLGVDINSEIVDKINQGEIHFTEEGLGEMVYKVVKNQFLYAKCEPSYADVFIIAVPTPFKKTKDKFPTPNTNYIFDAAKSISKFLRKGNLIILESTSPVGTTKKLAHFVSEQSGIDESEFNIAYCPARVLPGQILNELVNNNRVIGGTTERASNMAENFYSSFCEGILLKTSAETAEMVKLTENSFRDVNVAFANELSIISDKLNIDVRELIKLANKHPRVNILQPSCGVGGHCIAVDPWFLVAGAEEITPLIQTSRKVNDGKSSWSINKIVSKYNEIKKDLKRNPRVGCFGITFKPNVDDLRESPALKITNSLKEMGIEVNVCEPNLNECSDFNLINKNVLIKTSDLLIFLVGHKEFENLDLGKREYIDLCGITSLK